MEDEGKRKKRKVQKQDKIAVAVGRRRRVVKEQPQSPTETQEADDIEDIVSWEFGGDEIHKIRERLLEWYDLNKRDLPWRPKKLESASPSPSQPQDERAYAVWVSEIMLQQTRVQTVIQYYSRWMHKWPTLHHLSQASLEMIWICVHGVGMCNGHLRRAFCGLCDDILVSCVMPGKTPAMVPKTHRGCAYKGAKMIVAEGGGFPKTVSELRKIRGIGDYTAGAIASIAFEEVMPVVDGNVLRVIARLRAISANAKDLATVKEVWKLAAQLVDPIRPGDFNQALMELGATLCTPLNPSCSSCPASGHCHALSISRQDSSVLVTNFPVKGVKVKQRHDFSAVCVVELLGGEKTLGGNQTDSTFLLVKRPDEGLLAGLWEFPSVLLDGEANLGTRREAVDRFLGKNFGLDPKKTCNIVFRKNVGEFVHIFTHIRLRIYVELLVVHLEGGKNGLLTNHDKETLTWKCVDVNILSSMGLTSAVRKGVLDSANPTRKNYQMGLSLLLVLPKKCDWRIQQCNISEYWPFSFARPDFELSPTDRFGVGLHFVEVGGEI
ncbi:A/G-specific adenine DNA glycosylase [Morella rubra]|uniref:Adenine DNA glycosylase n=1 Tax=Morella rubra TaxID=262757 RepID=A0A6A1VBP3_9ROSI|nr:A/G-specific adenine DNA glycosylase [Morella rubra]